MKTANIMAQNAAILCDHGLQAYMAQDYQTAIPYYQAPSATWATAITMGAA